MKKNKTKAKYKTYWRSINNCLAWCEWNEIKRAETTTRIVELTLKNLEK